MKVVRIHPKARERLFPSSFALCTPNVPQRTFEQGEVVREDKEQQELSNESLVPSLAPEELHPMLHELKDTLSAVIDTQEDVAQEESSHEDAIEGSCMEESPEDQQEITQQEVAVAVMEAEIPEEKVTVSQDIETKEAETTFLSLQEDEPIKIQYIDRVKHVFSHWHTTDEEVAYAETLMEIVDTIDIQTKEDGTCEVIVQTDQAVYHFYRFRTNYEGHSSRALLKVLDHFIIALSMDFLLENPSLTIYVTGQKVVVGDTDYLLHYRLFKHRIVEPVQWYLSSDMLDRLDALASAYEIDIELVVEQLLTMQIQENEQKESPADL